MMHIQAFSELRAMADEGSITYPYSTREVVNIVKHLQVKLLSCSFVKLFLSQRFPDDGLGTVVRNVFDFDGYSKEVWISTFMFVKMLNFDPPCQVRDTLTEVLHKHGNGDALRNNKIS